jgi:predicted phage baseplate assembly protein
MPLLLPNLDDRTWSDLVAEATSLLPVYGPEWTDQNYSDPGITLIELCAWIAEMDIYQLNQISNRERLRFLALVGVAPRPPQPARAVLSMTLNSGVGPVALPAGVEFSGLDPMGVATLYRTTRNATLVPGSLQAMQTQDSSDFRDLTATWNRGGVLAPFGNAPGPGTGFYLGFSAPLPVDEPAQLYLTFSDDRATFAERLRIIEQIREASASCNPKPANPCLPMPAAPVVSEDANSVADQLLTHYGVRLVWEYLAASSGQPVWVALNPSSQQVVDETRAFTLDGTITFRVPGAMASTSFGAIASPNSWVRCRFLAGRYDATPVLKDIAFNGIPVVQALPASASFVINADAVVTYSPAGPPAPNTLTTLVLTLDAKSNIASLTFGSGAATDPQFRVLAYKPPQAGATGSLCIEALLPGFGTGFPHQQATVAGAPVEYSSLQIFTLESDGWHDWRLQASFDASKRTDPHAVFDATTGVIAFGNGEKGRVPPDGCLIFVVARTTRAEAGNLGDEMIDTLADSPENRALLYDPAAVPDGWTKLNSELQSVANPLPAWGGVAAETVSEAAGRADQLVESSGRAVTLADYEQLAAATPGTRIARVTAIANLHPDFPCYKAPGVVTVIVLPYLPQGAPMPTAGLLRAVAAYLRPRRVIGTRVEVIGPTYRTVAVQATVQSQTGSSRTALQQAIVAALDSFLDPLIGGAEGSGWPFGRDVYRSEIMKVIDSVPGVDYIASLALIADGGQAQCGNVCLGPTWLVQAGTHEVTVL